MGQKRKAGEVLGGGGNASPDRRLWAGPVLDHVEDELHRGGFEARDFRTESRRSSTASPRPGSKRLSLSKNPGGQSESGATSLSKARTISWLRLIFLARSLRSIVGRLLSLR